MSFFNIGKNQLKEIKETYRIIEDDNESEEDSKKIITLFRKANKNSIDWASLFVYCYEQLILIRHKAILTKLHSFSGIFAEISDNLEEYNRPIAYGKNDYYNNLKITINKNLNDIRSLVNFTFTKILTESEGNEDY